jgi:hypothetical protein
VSAAQAGLAVAQVEVLTRAHGRILRRTVVIDCVVHAERLDPYTMREAVAELIADFAEVARAIGAILRQPPL